MAVRVSTAGLSESQKDILYRNPLTFVYKEKNILRYKSKHKLKPRLVPAYREQTCPQTSHESDVAFLPLFWAKQKFGLTNKQNVGNLLSYQSKLGPRDDLQTGELAAVISNLRTHGSCALTVRMGAGKTALSLFTACELKLLTIVFVHNSKHCAQWTQSVAKYTTAQAEIIETDTNGIHRDTQIIICLYTRWAKIPACVRSRVGFVVVDECDEFNNPGGVDALLSVEPAYFLGCTATFKRSGTGLHVIMEAILGHAKVTREFDVRFDVHKILTGIEGDLVESRYTKGNDWLVLKQSLLYSEERNELITKLVALYRSQGRKIMILCTEIKHMLDLHRLLTEAGIDNDYMGGGKASYTDRAGLVLIGITECCGRGFDQESGCVGWKEEMGRIDTVMIVDFVNNDEDRMQWMGRGLRPAGSITPLIVHLVDDNNTVRNQWRNAEKMYLGLKGTIYEYQIGGKKDGEDKVKDKEEEDRVGESIWARREREAALAARGCFGCS